MMKKLFALLMALMLFSIAAAETVTLPLPPEETPAVTEDSASPTDATPVPLDGLAPFSFDLPEGVLAVGSAGGASVTFVHGNGTTRVVAMVLSRVPDPEGDHEAELARLMAQFAPQAEAAVPLTLAEGCHGLMAEIPNALTGLGERAITQVTAMALWQSQQRAELLILSGYDMAGDTAKASTMVGMLLDAASLNGTPLRPVP